jgi:hypothetical protein
MTIIYLSEKFCLVGSEVKIFRNQILLIRHLLDILVWLVIIGCVKFTWASTEGEAQ